VACIHTFRPNASVGGIPLTDGFPSRRATTTLGYVAATDADVVVRVIAWEVADDVHAFECALVSLWGLEGTTRTD